MRSLSGEFSGSSRFQQKCHMSASELRHEASVPLNGNYFPNARECVCDLGNEMKFSAAGLQMVSRISNVDLNFLSSGGENILRAMRSIDCILKALRHAHPLNTLAVFFRLQVSFKSI